MDHDSKHKPKKQGSIRAVNANDQPTRMPEPPELDPNIDDNLFGNEPEGVLTDFALPRLIKDPEIPHHPEIEKAVLGVLIIAEDLALFDSVSGLLLPTHFFLQGHQEIFETMQKIREKKGIINCVMLVDHLRRKKALDRCGGLAYITTLWDGIPRKSDLSEECKMIRDAAKRRQMLKISQRLAAQALSHSTDTSEIIIALKKGVFDLSVNTHSPIEARCMADVKPQKVSWLWDQWIPMDMITLFEGIEGMGKSHICAALAAAISCGKGMTGLNIDGPQNVLWFSAEDSCEYSISPKLLDVGADRKKVFVVDQVFSFDTKGFLLMEEQIEKHKPVLVIIDPIFAYVEGDGNKECDARVATNRLKSFAERHHCAFILVRHPNKSKGHGDPRAAGSGSIGWRAAARNCWIAGCDPDDKTKRAITQTKNSHGDIQPAIGYMLRGNKDKFTECEFSWTGASDLTAERILSAAEIEGAEDREAYKLASKNAMRQAQEILAEILSDGKLPSDNVKADARRAGVSEITLKRAKDLLGVNAVKVGKGKDSVWYWELPKQINLFEDPQKTEKTAQKGIIDPQHDPLLEVEQTEQDTGEILLRGSSDEIYLGSEHRYISGNDPLKAKTARKGRSTKTISKGDHVEDHDPLSTENPVMTRCKACGAVLEPDGSCEICSKEMPF